MFWLNAIENFLDADLKKESLRTLATQKFQHKTYRSYIDNDPLHF